MENSFFLFLAHYPQKDQLKEGMSQRVVAIDQHFSGKKRVYLNISPNRFRKKTETQIGEDLIVYNCNLFFHVVFILNLVIRSESIYFHSLHNVLPVVPFLFLKKKTSKMVWDVHGAVPEELALAGNKLKASLCLLAERYMVNKADHVIVVSEAMKKHLLTKHKSSQANFTIYPILPSHVLELPPIDASKPNDKLIILYSGNLQKWQNIDLMLEIIKNNLSDKISYYILTGEKDKMNNKIIAAGLGNADNIIVLSLEPSELSEYYAKAHYGFALRDDIVVNRVACPTKIVEYLYYGVTPIVKTENIGDFAEMGYEYIKINEFSENLEKKQSIKNHNIICEIIIQNEKINLLSLLST